MRETTNECVGCPPEMGCLGDSCPNRNVTRLYCDECGDETQLYYYDGQELCIDCITELLKETLEKVEV